MRLLSLELDNPQKLISRTESILVPQEFYEQYGLVPNIVFPTSVTIGDNGQLDIWYGAADTVCAKASVKLHDLMRALDPEKPARTFSRAPQNPILSARGDGFESRDVFNAAAIDINGSVYILYRAMNKDNTSTIGLAISKDGTTIDERLPEPVYVPREEFEKKKGSPTGNSGCEDPRIVRIEDTLYMTYTAYDGVHSPKGAATSISVDDFLARRGAWELPTSSRPTALTTRTSHCCLKRYRGNYLLYHCVNNQVCADLLPDLASGKRLTVV